MFAFSVNGVWEALGSRLGSAAEHRLADVLTDALELEVKLLRALMLGYFDLMLDR